MGRNLTFSPSKLEQFRKFIDEEMGGFITEEKVIESIKSTQVWSAQMTTGSAYHAIIENGHEPYLQPDGSLLIVGDDIPEAVPFTMAEALPAIQYRQQHPGLIFEVPHTWDFKIGSDDVHMRMRLDGMFGQYVHEHKTLYNRKTEMESYEDSLQWKIYLLSTGAKKVQYNIFEHKKLVNDTEAKVTHVKFDLFPYPKMLEDVMGVASMFIRFCEDRDLMEYVSIKG